jgi:hypothetical protein
MMMGNFKGRRVAITAGAVAVVVILVVGFVAKHWLLEEWNIHRLRTGDVEAKKTALQWMTENGEEDSFLAISEFEFTRSPTALIVRDLTAEERPFDQRMEPAASKWAKDFFSGPGQEFQKGGLYCGKAIVKIRERLGAKRLEILLLNILNRKSSNARMRAYMARSVILKRLVDLGPDAESQAILVLRDSLTDPDLFVRAGAAYGLADARDGAKEIVNALEAMGNDQEPIVREAAEYAVKKIRGEPR